MLKVIPEQKAWNQILKVRENTRFKGKDIVDALFPDFIELHGDRSYGDDKSILCGLASHNNIPLTIIAQDKGHTLNEQKERHYGMPLPEGYRKSQRIMKQANKFRRPIICIVDTPGAYPGINAEERGQAEAIAKNLFEMSLLTVPVISIVIGEGGSGGALALSFANKIIMLEHAVFSVVSAEGCASILWKDSRKAPEAAAYLKITAKDLLSLGIVDDIIMEEPSFEKMIHNMKTTLTKSLRLLLKKNGEQLKLERNQKFRAIGRI